MILAYDATHLGLGKTQSGFPLAALGIGVGLGCLVAGKLSASKVEYGLIPLGALGLTVTALAFAAIGPGLVGTIVVHDVSGDLQRLALCSAQCALAMAIAARPPGSGHRDGERPGLWRHGPRHVPGPGAGPGRRLGPRHVSRRHRSFWPAASCGRFSLVPDAFLRFILIGLSHTLYRVRFVGRSNIPAEGGALLVPNHVTFADGLFIIASTDRPVRFVIYATPTSTGPLSAGSCAR